MKGKRVFKIAALMALIVYSGLSSGCLVSILEAATAAPQPHARYIIRNISNDNYWYYTESKSVAEQNIQGTEAWYSLGPNQATYFVRIFEPREFILYYTINSTGKTSHSERIAIGGSPKYRSWQSKTFTITAEQISKGENITITIP